MATPRDTPTTALMTLLRACKDDTERERLAELSGTTKNYLYSLSGCHRGQPKLKLGLQIAHASIVLNRETKGRTPIVTAEELASMCDTAGFEG